MSSAALSQVTQVTKTHFGTTHDGRPVDVFTLHNAQLDVTVITYGARVASIVTPDRSGRRENIALGYKTLAEYEADKSYFGALVGRYANRLAKGQFTIAGRTHQVPVNNPPNALHGGPLSFAHKVWSAHEVKNGVEMELVSPAGEMGFPGTLTVLCRYELSGGSIHVHITAKTDAETVLNLTNHTYFNLAGEGSGVITNQRVRINADRFVPVTAVQIPTGELAQVAGTPFDFKQAHIIGERIDTPGNEQLKIGGGYDHTWVLNGVAGMLRDAASAADPVTGRTLTVLTTEPGVQFYTGNSLDGTATGPRGQKYIRRSGLCFEAQHFPDSPNQPSFPSTTLKPGQTYTAQTVFTFGAEATK